MRRPDRGSLFRVEESTGAGKRGARREAKGQAQFEFLISILTIMFTLFWMFELIMAVYTMNVLSDAAKEGVRCAILHGTWQATPPACLPADPSINNPTGPPTNCPDVSGLVTNYAKYSLHDISGMTVNVTYPDGGATPCVALQRVRVDVQYPYVAFIKLPLNLTMHGSAEGRFIF